MDALIHEVMDSMQCLLCCWLDDSVYGHFVCQPVSEQLTILCTSNASAGDSPARAVLKTPSLAAPDPEPRRKPPSAKRPPGPRVNFSLNQWSQEVGHRTLDHFPSRNSTDYFDYLDR